MSNSIELTFTQCKQLISNGYDLREFIEQIENQPDFIKSMSAIDSVYELQAIQQGGCASGAYMPVVTYHTASECMHNYGDDVLELIEDFYGEIPHINIREHGTWDSVAVYLVSLAVELWVSQFDLDGVNWD